MAAMDAEPVGWRIHRGPTVPLEPWARCQRLARSLLSQSGFFSDALSCGLFRGVARFGQERENPWVHQRAQNEYSGGHLVTYYLGR